MRSRESRCLQLAERTGRLKEKVAYQYSTLLGNLQFGLYKKGKKGEEPDVDDHPLRLLRDHYGPLPYLPNYP